MANKVYDPQADAEHMPGRHQEHPPGLDTTPAGDPQTTPKGDASDPRGEGPDNLGNVRDAENEGSGLNNPEGEENSQQPDENAGEAGEEDSEADDEGSDSDRVGRGYKDSDDNPKNKRRVQGVRKHLIYATLLAAATGVGFAGFMSLLPLKTESLVTGLEKHFSAPANAAVENENHNIFVNFLKNELAPAMAKKQCQTVANSVVSKDCRLTFAQNNTNPVINLYKTWSQAKLENELSDKYGIELRYDTKQRIYYLKSPGINGEAKVGDATGITSDFEKVDRSTVRQAFKDAEEGMTLWQKLFVRYKWSTLLQQKYGIKRCLIFCAQKDALSDKKDAVLGGITEKKAAAQIYLIQRVLIPYNSARGIALACLISTSCNPLQTQPTAAESGTNGELSGAPENPETDTALRSQLEALAGTYGGSVDDALKEYAKMKDSGFQKYAINYALEKVRLSDLTDKVTSAIPVIGWISNGSTIITKLSNAGPQVKKLAYIAVAPAAVSMYMEYRTYVDEVHTSHVDATELGSINDSLGPGNQEPGSSEHEIGGTADATDTPLYHYINEGNGASSPISDISTGTAYAASISSTSRYRCNNGSPVPSGSLVCPELKIGAGNATLNSIHTFLGQSFIGTIASAVSVISSAPFKAIQAVSGPVISFLVNTLGLGSLFNLLSSAITPFFNSLFKDVIPNPFSSNMSGGRKYEGIALGNDIADADVAHTTLGGRVLSTPEANAIINEQQNEARQAFLHESIFARMFDTSSDYSLVSKLAVGMPTNFSSFSSTAVNKLISNPFSVLARGFGSIFASPVKASVLTNIGDPFGETQYGYTQTDIDNIGDASTYWDQHCTNDPSQGYQIGNSWNQAAAATLDPNTEMPENTTTNPCLLIEATVGSAGGLFDTSLLTSDELGGTGGSTTSPTQPSQPVTTGSPSGIIWPFSTKNTSQYERVDQGWDVQTTAGGAVYAIAPGTLNVFAPDNGGFGNDYPTEQLDSPISSYGWVYYGHVHVIPSLIGKHVTTGELIAYTNTVDGQNGSAAPPGWLEIGFAQPGTDAPVQRGAEGVATQAGQDMKNTLINAQPAGQ